MFGRVLQEGKQACAFCFSPGIHAIQSPLGDRIMRQFLLVGDQAALLVDTGLHSTPVEQLAPYVKAIGLDPALVRYVLITHADFDHQGGNLAARRLFPGALFVCHRLDQAQIESTDLLIAERYGEFRAAHGIEDGPEITAWIRAVSRSETPIDIALENEMDIRLSAEWTVRVLHTPGHSRGHLSIWDPRSHTAIIADAALSSYLPARDGSPAFPPTYRYVDTYRQTIARLQHLNAANLLTSHFPLMSDAAATAFLRESQDFVDRLQELVYREIVQSRFALSARELIERLSPRLDGWPPAAAQNLIYPLIGHLESLEKSGLVRSHQTGPVMTWTFITGGR